MTKPILTLEEIDVAVAVAAAKAKAKKSEPKIAKAFDPKAGSDQEARSVVTLKCASEFYGDAYLLGVARLARAGEGAYPSWPARGWKNHTRNEIRGGGYDGRWPDGTRATKGNVVIWSGEDDQADTLVPRLSVRG